MTRNRVSRAVLALLRAALPSVLAFAGLTAVIVGILAMHVWMGGHGSSHHVAAPTSTTTSTHPGAEAHVAAGSTPGTQQGDETGHAHAQPATAVIAAGTATVDAASSIVAEGGSVGCGGDCADEMVLGACALAMIVVGVAGLLTPAGRALLSILGRRGPPAPPRASRPAPAPSLIRLCISRT
ncbi:hypothetical protein [Arthrobacter sp. B0490]|uniref:hypothetical protein n=1 Tax=Arthrobacter sp. B0490 TaxID=2058891 RepID=UPI000CE31F68|nr:hypothetical protein [Arthrobacter sp. B0490]